MAGHHTGDREMKVQRRGPHKMGGKTPAKKMSRVRMRGTRGVRK